MYDNILTLINCVTCRKYILMQIPFQIIDWSSLPATEHKGETGTAYWRTIQYEGLRVRMVEYTANYKADHWCEKGHIILCVKGEMSTELSDGSIHHMKEGMSYHVSDGLSKHRSFTDEGVKLFILDGNFLK
jgi:hypothetical protein